jgi:hypothetical protein
LRCIFLHSRGNCCSVLRVAPTTPLGRNRPQKIANMPDHDQFWVVNHEDWKPSQWPDFIPLDSSDSDSDSSPDASEPSPPPRNTTISRKFRKRGWTSRRVDDAEHEDSDDGKHYGENGRSENDTCLGRDAPQPRSSPVHPHAFRSVDSHLAPGTSWLKNLLASVLRERHRQPPNIPRF